MPVLIEKPTRIEAAGNKPKLIDEYVGRVNSGHGALGIAHMRSPAGWIEPGQTPEFDEYTVVLRGLLRVEHRGGTIDVRSGQAVISRQGEWVRYSTPEPDGAEYIAVCSPAFSLEGVRRDGLSWRLRTWFPPELDRSGRILYIQGAHAMLTATFTEFRNNTKKFFDAVEDGETVEIYRHGKPVAVLAPARNRAGTRWKQANPVKVKGVSLSRLILAERRESGR